MKLAAVDIGSNAIRLQITSVIKYLDNLSLKKVEYLRFPLRLGHDVFTKKEIGTQSEAKFLKLMQAFKILIDLYEVEDYMACATSAMREATNGQDIARRIKNEIGLKIHIIDGNKEAEIINKAINLFIDEKPFLHVDVGGGSTELNIYVNKQKTMAKSFPIGSVRRLKQPDSPLVWKKMKEWLEKNVRNEFDSIRTIATGGNINKLFEISKTTPGSFISYEKALEVQKHIASFSLDERINLLKLNPDRADVIVPATEIYISVMEYAHSCSLGAPDVGLKDGMMQLLFEKNKHKLNS